MDRQRELLLHQITALLMECNAHPDGDPWLEHMGRAVAAARTGVALGIGAQITRDANIRIGHYVKENPDVKVGPIFLQCPMHEDTTGQRCPNPVKEFGLCATHSDQMGEHRLSKRRDNGDRT